MNKSKAPTPDGERTRLAELNTVPAPGDQAQAGSGPVATLKRAYRNFNLVLAGMYTGLGCYGTPNTHHSYESESESGDKKPDNRPI